MLQDEYRVPVKAVWAVGSAIIATVAAGAAWMTTMSFSVQSLQKTTESVTASLEEFMNQMHRQTQENRDAIAEVRAAGQTKESAREDREELMHEIRGLDRTVTRLTVIIEQQTSILERISNESTMILPRQSPPGVTP